MAFKITPSPVVTLLLLLLFVGHSHAFGAGNIGSTSKIEGSNWRHGDIEDTLLTLLTARAMGGKKFTKLDVKRVYFGNWLRDYSQAVDMGTVKYVSAEAIRILLWILGFMSFGYGTGEFEVTAERLGCYRPEEHIDNPKDYADNLDARQYDPRLRGPVDEPRELSIDERTGLKRYIASEDVGITTSAGLVRNLLGKCIDLGRQYTQSKNEADLYEALRLLGTACHCLEDFSAHSNYVELSLIELGERNVFPHVGRNTQVQIQGARQPVYPIVTGTFGGVDFLHSVTGEFSDKVTQSEIQELEGTIQQSKRQDPSLLKKLLSQLPSGMLGGSDAAGKADQLQANAQAAQVQNMNISPKQPEAFTVQVNQLSQQIYPILEFHDNIMKHIAETIEKIPVLPQLLEQLQDQVNMFVFSLIAPYILPIINQVKTELRTGSGEIIQSSREKQLIVFHDDSATDPTHSMLSKDHFSNLLNEPAGKVASHVLQWVVPQVVACWDNPSIDIRRTNNRIINGVFHHPALREYGEDGAVDGRQAMFGVVEQWWRNKSEQERKDFRHKLGRDGVMQGRNHIEGVHDSGHGCGKPLGMPNAHTASSSGAIGGLPVSALGGSAGGMLGQAVGGGVLGAVAGMAGESFFGSEGEHSNAAQKQKRHDHQGGRMDHYPAQGAGLHEQQFPGPAGRHHRGRKDDSDDDSDKSHDSDDAETRQGRRQRRQEKMQKRQERVERREEKEDKKERREEKMERREEKMERREEKKERKEERREEKMERRQEKAERRRSSSSRERRRPQEHGRGGGGMGGRGGRGGHHH